MVCNTVNMFFQPNDKIKANKLMAKFFQGLLSSIWALFRHSMAGFDVMHMQRILVLRRVFGVGE